MTTAINIRSVDRYLGHVHENMSVLLREAVTCFEAVVATGDMRICRNTENHRAVPTIRSAQLPNGPAISVNTYDLNDNAPGRGVSVHIEPGDIGTHFATPWCFIRIVVEEVGNLVPRDADEITTAHIVLHTAVHHLDKALDVARRIGITSENQGIRYDIPRITEDVLRSIGIEGLIGVEQPTGSPRLKMHTPTPWSGAVVRDLDAQRRIEPVAEAPTVIPKILRIRTTLDLDDGLGRGNGASLDMSSFPFLVQALEPMERLRILADRTGRKG